MQNSCGPLTPLFVIIGEIRVFPLFLRHLVVQFPIFLSSIFLSKLPLYPSFRGRLCSFVALLLFNSSFSCHQFSCQNPCPSVLATPARSPWLKSLCSLRSLRQFPVLGAAPLLHTTIPQNLRSLPKIFVLVLGPSAGSNRGQTVEAMLGA